jgi:hypothetical protein
MQPARVGIVWYRREEDYVRLKAMYSDGEALPEEHIRYLDAPRNQLRKTLH